MRGVGPTFAYEDTNVMLVQRNEFNLLEDSLFSDFVFLM